MPSEPLTSIRDDHKHLTRTRILDAAAELIGETGEGSVPIKSVAALAGVSDRTIYRHFETRGALVQSVWRRLAERMEHTSVPRTGNELIVTPTVAFPRFDDERELMQAYLHWHATHGRRGSSNDTSRKEMLQCIRREFPNLGEDKLRRRAAIAQLLISVTAWDWMSRRWDFDGIEAGDAAAEALQVLLGRRPAQ